MTAVLDYTPAIDPIVNQFRLDQIKRVEERTDLFASFLAAMKASGWQAPNPETCNTDASAAPEPKE